MQQTSMSLNVLIMDDSFYEKLKQIVENAIDEYHNKPFSDSNSFQKISNKVSLKKACQLLKIGYSTSLIWKKKGFLRTYGSKKGSFVFLNEFKEDYMKIQQGLHTKK